MPRKGSSSSLKRNKLPTRKSNTSTIQPPPKHSFFKPIPVQPPPPLSPSTSKPAPSLPLPCDSSHDKEDEENNNKKIQPDILLLKQRSASLPVASISVSSGDEKDETHIRRNQSKRTQPVVTVSSGDDESAKSEQPIHKRVPPVRIKLSDLGGLSPFVDATKKAGSISAEHSETSQKSAPPLDSSTRPLVLVPPSDDGTSSQETPHKPRRSSRLASQEKPTPMKLRISPPTPLLSSSASKAKRKSTSNANTKNKNNGKNKKPAKSAASASFFPVKRQLDKKKNDSKASPDPVTIDLDHVSSSSLEEIVLPSCITKPSSQNSTNSTIPPFGNLSFVAGVVSANMEPNKAHHCCTNCGTMAKFEYKQRDSPVTPPIKTIAPARRRRVPTRNSVHDIDADAVDEDAGEYTKPITRSSKLSISRQRAERLSDPEDVNESTKPVTRSRLSISRKRAEAAKNRKTLTWNTDDKKDVPPPKSKTVSINEEVVDLCAASPKRTILFPPRDAALKRRKTAKATTNDDVVNVDDIPDDTTTSLSADAQKTSKPPTKLHSFFSKQQRSMSAGHVEVISKQLGVPDAWNCGESYVTKHFTSSTIYHGRCSRKPPNTASTYLYEKEWSGLAHLTEPLPCFDNFCSNTNKDLISRLITRSEAGKTSLWSQVYQNCMELDRFNEAPISSLQRWLQMWYATKERGEESSGSASGYSSGDSIWTEDLEFERPEDMEKIAILTGPTGSGKSTILKVVAKRLGLSIVEINATMCRSSKKVKQIVLDAMKIHRVARGSAHFGSNIADNDASNGGGKKTRIPRSLIVFEEVDMLHDDEKGGFWRMIREIISDDSCKRPMVFTADTITAGMQAILGYTRPTIDSRADVHNIVTPERFEEQSFNIIPFQHIRVEGKTRHEISIALETVANRENLKLPADTLQRFTRLMDGNDSSTCGNKDLRSAINTLQLLTTTQLTCSKKDAFEILPQASRRIRMCAETIFGKRKRDAKDPLVVAREGSNFEALLDAMYLAATEKLDDRRRSSNNNNNSNLDAIADALETFSEADTYSLHYGCFTEHSIADENEVVPDADLLHNWKMHDDIAVDLKAHALTRLGGRLHSLVEAEDVAAETVIKYEIAAKAGKRKKRILEGYTPILATRTAATDIVPMLRTMAVASRNARERAQKWNDASAKSRKTTTMDNISFKEKPSFSRIGMGTRSRTRGNHMHLLGVGEEACLYLESQVMLRAQEDEVILV